MAKKLTVPEERIIRKIVLIREENVILDLHLAELYWVETRALKQAVKRNINRFPEDFMFELNDEEIEQVVSQIVIPNKKYFGGARPFAFTETGVAMLSSVLKSERAVAMNITIMRTFVALRKIALNYAEIVRELEKLKKENNVKFNDIFTALDYLLTTPEEEIVLLNPIGFHKS